MKVLWRSWLLWIAFTPSWALFAGILAAAVLP
jgi:hypothetical protein